ncbi:MAG: pilus assembly PilX family protein [Aureliella sp.]
MNTRNMSQPRRRRRGTIYVIVLLSSLLVATIGVSALQLVRLQSRMASDYSDFIAARAYARAAIEIGMLKVRNDKNWRSSLGNGNWVTDNAIDAGKYSLSALDPVDNDVTQGDNHPIVLTGTGKKGNAAFKVSARLEVGPRGGSCLEVSMTSGSATTVNASTLTSNQSVCSNGTFDAAGGSTLNADVEAYGAISGGTYAKTTSQRTLTREMPDPAHALDSYLSSGTTIPYSALPQWSGGEAVTNGGFEQSTSDWYAKTDCTVQRAFLVAQSGLFSLRVRARATPSDVAATDLPLAALASGNKYHLSMPINATSNGTGQAILTLESTGDGVQTFATPTFTVTKNVWTDLNGDVVPTWTGTLIKATLYPSFSFRNDYYSDAVSVTDVTYPAGHYVIDGKLISPSVNPFGAVNPKGIYIIDCNGQDVDIGRSRIVGTLVFRNPGPNTTIAAGVNWEAAEYNYPALLTDSPLTIALGSGAVSESTQGVNFNPAGTPYPFLSGSANDTLTESYPSKITGLIYSTSDIRLTDASTLSGIVVANQNVDVSGANVSLNYVSTYMDNPPPGFDIGTITMKIVPGTWQRSVN